MNKITKSIPDHWKIDSLRLELPKKYVDISHKFTDEYVLWNKTTGEETELQCFQKADMLEHTAKSGVKYYTRLYNRAIRTKEGKFSKDKETWLQVFLSSKMLGSLYWDGITEKTIKKLYDTIMSLDHFKCTYEVFLNSLVFDVDYCKDYEMERPLFNDFTKEKPFAPNSYKLFTLKNNVSTLQFNFREKGTFERPYFKIYNKLDEFKSRSRFEKLNLFYKTYDLPIPKPKHFRKEITINSKKGFSSIASKFPYKNTLSDAIRLLEDKEGMSSVLSQLESYKVKKIVQPKDYKSIPLLISMLIGFEKKGNLTNDEIIKKYRSEFADANFHRNTITNLVKEVEQQIDLFDLAQTDFALNMAQSEFDEANELCFGL